MGYIHAINSGPSECVGRRTLCSAVSRLISDPRSRLAGGASIILKPILVLDLAEASKPPCECFAESTAASDAARGTL